MPFNSEKEFEDALIAKLTELDNQWSRTILEYKTEDDLIANWAEILFNNNNETDKLNGVPLTKTEMTQIISQINGESPFALNRRLNGRYISITRDNPKDTLHNGKRVDLFLFDKDEIAAGRSVYQIARQPRFHTSSEILGNRRGDLMLLINGMPLYHIELKNTPVKVEQACNQISKYMQHGVFTGFFSFVQVFVAMTPEETLYFANPGRDHAFNSDYYFHWADFNNRYINGWEEIAEKFLSIPMAHRLIGYGTIADGTDNVLKVMRSYQYHAAYKIYSQVVKRTDWDDKQQKGGYIYHTTGSGKTMTSFKCAQLIKSSGKVDKIIFVMDRDELWKQTYDNYRNFSDCDDIEDTANTNILLSKLENDTQNLLVVTSIQKMSLLTTVEPTPLAARIEKVARKKLAFIVDEAHRSTFGTMLRDIKITYQKAMFFGFTGTPIQLENAKDGITTEGLFGGCLHKYTILEGIRDKNVLGFRPSKLITFDEEDFRSKVALQHLGKSSVDDLTDEEFAKYHKLVSRKMIEVEADVNQNLYSDDETGRTHRENVVRDILSKWDRISFRGRFHYILATTSIWEAIAYQDVFVPSLGQNIIGMNNDYQRIIKLYEKNGIENFSRLPDSQTDINLFADLFNNISNYYYRSIPQLFTWTKRTYNTEGAGKVTVLLDERTYEVLRQRYSEIPRTVQPGEDIIYDIKAFLTEVSSDEINRAFMESKFSEVLKDLSNGAKPEDIKDLLDELKSNFTILSAEDQITAEAILEDIYSGSLKDFDENKSLAEYIEIYNRNALNANIARFCSDFGFDKEKLLRIMAFHLDEENLLRGGFFDQVMATLDRKKAKMAMEEKEGAEIKPHRVVQKAEQYLKRFILSGGKY